MNVFFNRLPSEPTENTLTEVDIRVQPLDIVLSSTVLRPFTKVYEPWLHFHLPDNWWPVFSPTVNIHHSQVPEEPGDFSQDTACDPTYDGGSGKQTLRDAQLKEPVGLGINSRSLPLLYLHLEGLRVFLPSDQPIEDDHRTCGHDLVLLHLASLLVSPQVHRIYNVDRQSSGTHRIYNVARQSSGTHLISNLLYYISDLV